MPTRIRLKKDINIPNNVKVIKKKNLNMILKSLLVHVLDIT